MATPELPIEVINLLASTEMRVHHARWHYVRDMWKSMPASEQLYYKQIGWEPPRLAGESGAGLDFIYMHRRMIERVNDLLTQINQQDYPTVVGWSPIPWDHQNVDWPMPPSYDPDVDWAKEQELTDFFHREVDEKYENVAWLRGVEVDSFASELERGIHNWMHMHWSSTPWYIGAPDQDRDDLRNDFLGSTYSSHVNKAFWKLHGWIDERISAWERATGRKADISGGWEGPSHDHIGPTPLGDDLSWQDSLPLSAIAPITQAEARHAESKFRQPLR